MNIFDEIDDMLYYFNVLYLDTLKQFIPYYTITINPKNKPWFNADVKYTLKAQNKAHKKWKLSQ